ncbi:FtsX-like permease family protein [Streptomyces orinoci]|uniref:FtsX-like permease family protein n=1 Tax=Streptomyces orinoci TaxID=67339 RepID=A0ABV3JSH2_STRON|nr:FtsX-like permease family protein [Streptomyces orinoci]
MSGDRDTTHPTGPSGPAAWLRDLLLGARFAVTGGRESRLRAVFTALGVGLGVALLMGAASVPHMLDARHQREAARAAGETPSAPSATPAPGSRTLLLRHVFDEYRDKPVHGALLRPDGPQAPVPPGLKSLPGPGEMVVSPAMARLMDSAEGRLLRERYPDRVIGTIGDQGLIGPNELYFYAGSDRLDDRSATRTDHFGEVQPGDPLTPELMVLAIMVGVVLLMPVAVFIATSVRFGGERRDRRLAALRLMGCDRSMIRRMAAGEALAASVLGLAVGSALFLGLRELASQVTIQDASVFPGDLRPGLPLVALIALAVPACAVLVALFALRGIAIEPLGVIRSARPPRRRLWWRLLFPAAGLALLVPAFGKATGDAGDPVSTYQVGGGAVLLLIGVTAVLPWLVESVVARFRGGSPSWQLAVRRLQLSSGPAARAVSGIAVAVAGAIAVQMLFAAARGDYEKDAGNPTHSQMAGSAQLASASRLQEITSRFRATPGVQGAISFVRQYANKEGADYTGEIVIADCGTLRSLATITSCRDGDSFVADSPDQPRTRGKLGPGDKLTVSSFTAGTGKTDYRWTVPRGAHLVTARPDPTGEHHHGVLVTPSAINTAAIPDVETQVAVKTVPGDADAIERVRNTGAHIDPTMRIWRLGGVRKDKNYAAIERSLLIGSVLTLALIGAGLLIGTLEQLRERKRLLSVLVAFGTRRRTLAWSVLWQTAIPVALGMAVAVAGGLALGWTMLRLVGRPVTDWWAFTPMTAAGTAVIALVTLLSLPPLLRMMRPDGLRTE